MKNGDKILGRLWNDSLAQYCDDCLSELLNIQPRQQINLLCRNLASEILIYRSKDICSMCAKYKITNRINYKSGNSQQKERHILDTNITPQNSKLSGSEFEQLVGKYLQNKFSMQFNRQKKLLIGIDKFHRFDWVSQDKSIVVECKNYTWTKSNNSPSAKFATLVETLFYFSRIKAKRKILVIRDDVNNKGTSLVNTFVNRYDGLLDDVEIWKYNIKTNNIKIARKPKQSWIKELFSRLI